MKFGGFIREELSAYKAHVTLSAKHLSQEHTGFASINKLHSDLLLFYHKHRHVIIGSYIVFGPIWSILRLKCNGGKYCCSTDTR